MKSGSSVCSVGGCIPRVRRRVWHTTGHSLCLCSVNDWMRLSLKWREDAPVLRSAGKPKHLVSKKLALPTPGAFGSQPHPVLPPFLLLTLTSTVLLRWFYLNFLQAGKFGSVNKWPFIPYWLEGKKAYFSPQYHCSEAGFLTIKSTLKSCKAVASKRGP